VCLKRTLRGGVKIQAAGLHYDGLPLLGNVQVFKGRRVERQAQVHQLIHRGRMRECVAVVSGPVCIDGELKRQQRVNLNQVKIDVVKRACRRMRGGRGERWREPLGLPQRLNVSLLGDRQGLDIRVTSVCRGRAESRAGTGPFRYQRRIGGVCGDARLAKVIHRLGLVHEAC
jgi:hypothetical protein